MAEQQSPSEYPESYQMHEVVWAKITGFPWWPARVTSLPSTTNSHYRVDFFADTTHAYVSQCKLARYQLMRHHPGILRQIKKNLRRAVAAADQFFEHFLDTPADPMCAHSRVEAELGLQKQLSETPIIKSTQLQERQGEQGKEKTRQEVMGELLRRYNLHNLEEMELPKEKRTRGCRKGIRRNKVKKICKKEEGSVSVTVSVEHLLARRLNHLLKAKHQLKSNQRRIISLSLARQVHHTNPQHSIDEVTRLLTWLSISPPQTILCYFQSWSSLHSEKDKGSDLTAYE